MMHSIRLLVSSIALASTVVLLACHRPAEPSVPGEGTRATTVEARVEWGMVIHGGAGTISRANMGPEEEREYRAALTEALGAGYRLLSEGGTSLDAVSAAIVILEDSPLFNAGRGAVFTADGVNSLDASIMAGAPLRR